MSRTDDFFDALMIEAAKLPDPISQAIAWAEEVDSGPRWDKQELDQVLTLHWPGVVRHVMADGSDPWIKGFVRSIARHGKRATWRPSKKQEHLMRRLLSEIGVASFSTGEVVET